MMFEQCFRTCGIDTSVAEGIRRVREPGCSRMMVRVCASDGENPSIPRSGQIASTFPRIKTRR
jgi:hypothetical protein